MATFEFQVGVPTVLTGVLKEAKGPKSYVFKYPTKIETFADMINAAHANKGKKDRHGDWEFVMLTDLKSQDDGLNMREDVYELDRRAHGKNTLRSKVSDYTVNGEKLWFFGIRALTDAEMARSQAKKDLKVANKDAVTEAELLKVIKKISK